MTARYLTQETPFHLLPALTSGQKEVCEAAARDAWHASRGLSHAERLAASRQAFGRTRATLQGGGWCAPWPEVAEGDVGYDACGRGFEPDNLPIEIARCA